MITMHLLIPVREYRSVENGKPPHEQGIPSGMHPLIRNRRKNIPFIVFQIKII